MSEHPIESAAESLLYRLAEQTEDVIDECCAELWPEGEDSWWTGIAGHVHNERTFAAVMRRLARLLIAAADAAESRVPRPVEAQGRPVVTPGDTGDEP